LQHGQRVVYLPGIAVNRASAGYRGGRCQIFCLRREALLVRAEVRDLCRLLVAVGGWS
jgi:hypothetical protein